VPVLSFRAEREIYAERFSATSAKSLRLAAIRSRPPAIISRAAGLLRDAVIGEGDLRRAPRDSGLI
jgi:hypothetical protein